MDRYYKNVENDYLLAIGTGPGGVEISKDEYDKIHTIILNRPIAEEGYVYKLRSDLTWVKQIHETVPPDGQDVIDAEEALGIILGGVAE